MDFESSSSDTRTVSVFTQRLSAPCGLASAERSRASPPAFRQTYLSRNINSRVRVFTALAVTVRRVR